MLSLESLKKMQPSLPAKKENSTEFSDEFKREAVSDVLKGRTFKAVAEFYSVKVSVISGFMKAYRNCEIEGLSPVNRSVCGNVHGRRYSKNFKINAVNRVKGGEYSREVAVDIGVANETVRRWESQVDRGILCL